MPSPEICPRETASWMYLSSFPAKLGLLNGIFKLIIYKLYIMNMNKYFVEFLGTMFFLFVILMSSSIGPSELQPVIIGAGLAIAIFVGGKISGGNFNPAVSVMMTAANKLSTSDLLPYIIAQILGGLAALQLTKVMKF